MRAIIAAAMALAASPALADHPPGIPKPATEGISLDYQYSTRTEHYATAYRAWRFGRFTLAPGFEGAASHELHHGEIERDRDLWGGAQIGVDASDVSLRGGALKSILDDEWIFRAGVTLK